MHGGQTNDGDAIGSTHILTIPGFHWFDAGIETNTRTAHACALLGERQMAVVGGQSQLLDWKTPDTWVGGIGILDITTLEWKSGYEADGGDYDSPQIVKDWYKNK